MHSANNKHILNQTVKAIPAEKVHEVLKKFMLIDGFELVLDLEKSQGLNIIDAKTGERYLDFFSFFASSPVGINHPKMNTKEFKEEIAVAALNKPSNSDIYTIQMASFVDTFSKIAMPNYFKYLFFIEGGALAVENGLKTAFDWKTRKNFQKGYKEEKGQKVIHFREAFHGRSGYTMSLTNTDPNKVALYPKFNWPRITNPKIIFPVEENIDKIKQAEEKAINEIYDAIKTYKDDIALIIIEPIQCEGGDNFFRKEFFIKLREIADENEILLMFDEVQTGIAMTGKMWAHQYFVNPDIIAFGKKTQVCGIMVNNRIDDVADNVFHKSSRINSTWGGNLADMVRSKKYLEIIQEEKLIDNAANMGKHLLKRLYELQAEFPTLVSQARGLGLLCSFDMPNTDLRNKFLKELYKEKVIMLGCGTKTIRFRPPLIVNESEIDIGISKIKNVLSKLANEKV
ncbi:L-lysine 6-transaminase [Melioribacteraceae bacterium 4301-Me]|uniref:L-lysine 6-transaminase n=1 Tax=Pyranulibacter aquaticus TaxID=3163344 RepID=UPI003598893E